MTWFWKSLSLIGCLVLVAIAWKIHLLGPVGLGRVQLWDFDAYYLLAQDIRQGHDPNLVAHMQTLGPPLVIAPFLPFSFLTLTTARMWFLWSNLVAWGAACGLLAWRWWPRYWWVVAPWLGVGLLSSFPARFTLIVGQPHGWVTLLLVIFLLTTQPGLIGVSWAVASGLKTFWLGLGLALGQKNVSSLSWGILTLACMVAALLLWIKPSFYQTFLTQKNQILWQQNQAQDVDYYNQSLKATLQRVGWPSGYRLVWLGLAGVLSWYVWKSGSRPVAIVSSVVLSPVVWQHYVVVLFPIVVWLWTRKGWNKWQLVGLSLATWAWWVEFPSLHGQPITLWTGLVASHYFWSMLLMVLLAVSHHSTQRGNSVSVS